MITGLVFGFAIGGLIGAPIMIPIACAVAFPFYIFGQWIEDMRARR